MLRRKFNSGWLLSLAVLAAFLILTLWLVDPRVSRLWLQTAGLAAGACLIALPLGTLLAVILVKTDVRGRRLATLLLVVHVVRAAVSGHGGMGRRFRHSRLAHAGHQSAPGARAVARRLAGRHLGARPCRGAVGRTDRRRRFASCRSRDRRRRRPLHIPVARAVARLAAPRRRSPSSLPPRGWPSWRARKSPSPISFRSARLPKRCTRKPRWAHSPSATRRPNLEDSLPLSALGLWLGLLLSTVIALATMLAAGTLVADLADATSRPPGFGGWAALAGPSRSCCGPSCCWSPACRWPTSFTKRGSEWT